MRTQAHQIGTLALAILGLGSLCASVNAQFVTQNEQAPTENTYYGSDTTVQASTTASAPLFSQVVANGNLESVITNSFDLSVYYSTKSGASGITSQGLIDAVQMGLSISPPANGILQSITINMNGYAVAFSGGNASATGSSTPVTLNYNIFQDSGGTLTSIAYQNGAPFSFTLIDPAGSFVPFQQQLVLTESNSPNLISALSRSGTATLWFAPTSVSPDSSSISWPTDLSMGPNVSSQFSSASSGITLTATYAVPEPSTMWFLVAGGIAVFIFSARAGCRGLRQMRS